MSGQTKIELLLEFKDRATTGITKARETINTRVKEMKEDLSTLKNRFVSSFTSMKEKIPSFNKAWGKIKIPYATIVKGLGLIKDALIISVSAAADFQSKFLQIENLNADKPKKSMLEYEKSIHDTAMTIGTDLGKTTDAYLTAQKNTEDLGQDMKTIVDPIARFSRAMGTDLTADIELGSKAVRAFKLESKGSEAYMKSSYTTAQMNKLSYSELAKEQMKFADATAKSGQSVNTANKMFTAFNTVTKDTAKASEMTKTAFLGLKDSKVKKWIESLNISYVDGNKKARDYSSIIQDVNTHFKNMSPASIKETIAQIGGSGGLSDLFIKLNGESKQFDETINNFDASKFDMDEAFARAMGSYNVLKEMVGTRFNTLMSTLGKGTLPIVSDALESINNGLLWVYNNIGLVKDFITIATWAVGAWALAWVALNAQFVFSQIAIGGMQMAMGALNLIMKANPFAIAIGLIVGLLVYAYKKSETFRAVVDGLWATMKAFGTYIKDGFVAVFKGAWSGIKGFFSNIWSGVKNMIGGIIDTVKGIGNIIGSAFSLDWDGVKKGASGVMDGIKRTGKGLIDMNPLVAGVKAGATAVETTKTEYSKNSKNRVNLIDAYKDGSLNSLLESKGLLKADGSRDMAKIEKLDLLKAGKQIDQEKLKAYKQPKEEEKQEEKKEEQKKGIPAVSQSSTASTENETVPTSFTGMGTASAAAKSVSIHVDSFVKGGINMLNGEGEGLSLSEIEDRFNEMFTRMLRRVETAQ
ncbi:hypothetical protein L3073_17540 [Ancylomarina sp. DW003]|nr:phage tail tape measure protein [Ancylomarina sp. DW003]MDE5424022.1 hypothetical protein [Ancylomarina sp. DW003]